MTAKVDGTLWEMNNPYGSDYATGTLFEMYPEEEYILLAGRINFMDEIRLYIKRSDLKVGTYPITKNTFDASKTQIEISFNTKSEGSQYPIDGSLSIISVDLNAKRVKGTFSFNCVKDDSKPISISNPISTRVTDGTFNYRYDVKQ